MFNLPNFARRRAKLETVTFVPAHKAFSPQRRITMTRDVNGWLGDPRERRRFTLSAGKSYMIDADKADEFIVKGYATGELSRAIGTDERAEITSNVTTISLGG